jgi:hypothetical protein
VAGYVYLAGRADGSATAATSEPSCAWPLSVLGDATREQIGLIRCYVKAVDQQDRGALSKLGANWAKNDPSSRVGEVRQFRDAQSGTATARFVPNAVDPADVMVGIRYSDGATVDIELHLANPMSVHSWRLQGVQICQGPTDPHCAWGMS